MNRIFKLMSFLIVGFAFGSAITHANEVVGITSFVDGSERSIPNQVLKSGEATLADYDHFIAVTCQYTERGLWGSDVKVLNLKAGQFTMVQNRGQWKTVSCMTSVAQHQIVLQGEQVLLTSRYVQGGSYETATYSFRYRTQGHLELTRNNFEVLYEAREDFKDYFRVNTVTDDSSSIFDLGNRSCSEASFDAYAILGKFYPYSTSDMIPVIQGHCYLTLNRDNDGHIETLFRVNRQWEHRAIVIGEITVLYDSKSRRY